MRKQGRSMKVGREREMWALESLAECTAANKVGAHPANYYRAAELPAGGTESPIPWRDSLRPILLL